MGFIWASLVAQLLKNPPAMRETWIRSLAWEDPREQGKADLSSTLAWRSPWTVVHGVAELDTTERLSLSFSFRVHSFMPSSICDWLPALTGASILVGETDSKNQGNRPIRVISGKQRVTAGRPGSERQRHCSGLGSQKSLSNQS